MNKNKLRKRLKRKRGLLKPKMPSIIKLVVPVKFFIQYFTNQINKSGQVTHNELIQLQVMKNLRDKLVFFLNQGHRIKLHERDIGNILLAIYVFRSALVNTYHDIKEVHLLNETLHDLRTIYISSAFNKDIAKHNLLQLERVYGK